ncbi:mycothiol system anti-sigma-R factor [Sanguibacter gelidistatuariae]|uniref:Mycothiol system anti-sigma-R factor n=1 Tax=Sanguibacter gelidistatuariae TaxID=1814289 RepID=A0A1G6VR02_9MICO|nr:mycothiol system anti-sigma-R factor [Sanguibacter gelidistatuariae]SDD56052.1 mycothiol system anti-sigma-R factor [Sanguibacter gelidistatuariae]
MSTNDNCDDVIGHLFEYLDSEMTDNDAERMRAHVAECSPCLAELSIDELVKRLLRRSCTEQAPEHLRVKIHLQITKLSAQG